MINTITRDMYKDMRVVEGVGFKWQGGLLFKHKKLVVPKQLESAFVRVVHKQCLHHQPLTYSVLLDICWWPHMYRDVTNFMKSCHECQLNAPPRRGPHAPRESMQRDVDSMPSYQFDWQKVRGEHVLVCVETPR